MSECGPETEEDVTTAAARDVIDKSSQNFSKMVGDFESATVNLTEIAAQVESVSSANNAVNANVSGIRDLTHLVRERMTTTETSVRDLSEASDQVQQLIGKVPVQFMQALPYVLTVILLAGFVGKAIPPRAGGVPYVKER